MLNEAFRPHKRLYQSREHINKQNVKMVHITSQPCNFNTCDCLFFLVMNRRGWNKVNERKMKWNKKKNMTALVEWNFGKRERFSPPRPKNSDSPQFRYHSAGTEIQIHCSSRLNSRQNEIFLHWYYCILF